MLHVSVHGNHCIAFGKVHAAGNGNLVPEIPGEGQGPHMGVPVCQLMNQLVRAIPGSIIYINDFIIHGQFLHDFCHFIMKVYHVAFFIIDRRHN